MKFRFLALLALVLGLASCQKDTYGLDVDANGEAAVTISVALPEVETRAGGNDSAIGAFGNVDFSKYDVRYILEVYNLEGQLEGELAKERLVNTENEAMETSFTLRLIPGRGYRFVVWADLVEEGKKTDLHYNTANLKNIQLATTEWGLSDETRDAYTGIYNEGTFSSTSNIRIELKRPLGKLRVVTTDIKDMFNVLPQDIKVVYSSQIYTSFDAHASNVIANSKQTINDEKSIKITDSKYANEWNTEGKVTENLTLFTDYYFAANEQEPISFTLDVKDNKEMAIPQVVFSTPIPIQRNYLTTVMGPVLTDANSITVVVNDAFANLPQDDPGKWNPEDDKYDVTVWDGQSTNAPVDSNGDGIYEISTGAQLAYLAAAVNGTLPTTTATRAQVDWSKQKYILTQNINLGGNEWTPIGGGAKYFAGTFDGNNKNVEDFTVTKQDGHAALFGNARAHIKNLNVKNVTIVSHHYAGAIVGQGYSKIEGCNVDNIDITLTTKNGDWGDKAGGIIGQNCEGAGMYVKNSTAKNVTIKGYRDLGGIAGMAHNSNTVSGCRVENITILQDLSVNYEDNTPTTLGAVIGRKGTNVIDENNTVGEGIEIAVLVANLEQLQAALDAAKAGDNLIRFGADLEGNATIKQADKQNIILDGCGKKFNGVITVNGDGRSTGAETLTFTGINFETTYSDTNDENTWNFITAPSKIDSKYNYSHNVTIENCTFTNTVTDNYMVGSASFTGTYNLVMRKCRATNMHSMIQVQSCDNTAVVDDVTTENCKNGVSFGNTANATLKNSEIVSTAYGVRGDGNASRGNLSIENTTITAAKPVIIRKVTTETYAVAIDDASVLNTTGTYHVIFTNGDDEVANAVPTGKYTITGADEYNVYPESLTYEEVKYEFNYAEETVNITAVTGAVEPTVYRGCISDGKSVGISKVNIGEGIVRLNNRSLCKSPNLTEVSLPNSLTYIDESVFQQSGFVSITIPENVTYIGQLAFGSCSDLEEIIINAKNVTLGHYVARACAKLSKVVINCESVTFEASSMYFTNKESGDASGITFYVPNTDIADKLYTAFSTSHSYGLKIVSLDGGTTYYNTLK